jgi:hypothetical protein
MYTVPLMRRIQWKKDIKNGRNKEMRRRGKEIGHMRGMLQ